MLVLLVLCKLLKDLKTRVSKTEDISAIFVLAFLSVGFPLVQPKNWLSGCLHQDLTQGFV